jgi:ATP-binding cassette subfamily B protein
MNAAPDKKTKISIKQSRTFAWRLLAYAKPYKGLLAISLTLILVMSFAVNTLPILIKHATDSYLVGDSMQLTIDARTQGLLGIGLLYIAIALFGFLCRYGQGLLTEWVGQKIIFDMRADVFKKILRLDLPFFDNNPVGRLMTRVTSDVDALQRFVTEGVVGTVSDIFMLLGVLGFMIYLSPPMALALIIILVPLVLSLGAVNRKLRQAHRDIRAQTSNTNSFLQENITGMSTIQLFNREPSSRADFLEHDKNLRKAHYKEVKFFSLYWPVLELFQGITTVLIIATGGLLLINKSPHMTIGVLVAYLAYIREFFRPLGSLSDKASTFQQAMASSERIFGLLDTEETIKNPEVPVNPEMLKGAIEFKNVWFAYEDEHWIIQDFNLSVKPGESIAIVGATGAGKSTLISLLARFYDVQKGEVKVDDINVRNFNKENLRQRIGIVLQEPFIFAGSVYENITLLNPEVDRDAAEAAAKMVNAHDFISSLPNGYDEILTERGGGLSLGQKQLLVMARTIAQSPDMLFVLDEATASVDTATEVLIQDALNKLIQTRTSIIIAHRLSTIRHVDRILVMKHGKLIDQGTHDELMEHGGYYHQLYTLLLHEQSSH